MTFTDFLIEVSRFKVIYFDEIVQHEFENFNDPQILILN
jgi:hypothetical protein